MNSDELFALAENSRLTNKVLVWVNHQREHNNFPPLNNLRTGERDSNTKCPIARSITESPIVYAGVGTRSWAKHYRNTRTEQRLPSYVEKWIRKFDNGDFVEYLEGKRLAFEPENYTGA